jgi:DNA invertase Pin-like site-specific DNA recombinase
MIQTGEQLDLIDTFEELDVSGRTPLAKRHGLRTAVEAIEARQADVIVAAYFDRLMRSIAVRAELVQRVEGAGGKVVGLDVGETSDATAAQWLSGNVLAMIAEYVARSGAERSAEAQASAVARGVIPFGQVPPGLRLTDDNRAEHVPEEVPVVQEAFRMRAGGASRSAVRAYLRDHGIERSYNGVNSMLSSRLMLGEINFGGLVNAHAFDPIIDPETFRRAQAAKAMPGRRAKSERLLARLGVLRCKNCDARMVVGTTNPRGDKNRGDRYWIYRCPPNNDCVRHVTISAPLVESIVMSEVRRLLADVEGSASAAEEVREADADLERRQFAVDAAVRAFTGLDGDAATERLAELAADRDRAQERVDSLSGSRIALTVTVEDWDRLTLAEQRGLIQASIARVTVAAGRGPERVTVEPFGQQP